MCSDIFMNLRDSLLTICTLSLLGNIQVRKYVLSTWQIEQSFWAVHSEMKIVSFATLLNCFASYSFFLVLIIKPCPV